MIALWLNFAVGVCWLVIAVLIAVQVDWPLASRLALIAMSVLLCWWRIEYSLWAAFTRPEQISYLESPGAIANNAAILLVMLGLITFLVLELRRKRTARRQ